MIQYIIENELHNLVENVSSVDIIRNGRISNISIESKYFSTFRDKIVDKLKNARVLPALAVCSHEEVMENIKSGDWIQINFDETKELNGLPFDSLLFNMREGNGYNLIRKYQGEYGGRCIFVYIEE